MNHDPPASSTAARRYFENAATSFPKPPGVAEAVGHYLTDIGVSAGRGAYHEAVESGRMLDECRQLLRRVFHADARDHVIFALNGTDALNLAVKSLCKPSAHVVTTAMDHNSVLRPLHALHDRLGVEITIIAADSRTTRIDPADVAAAIRPNTTLVAINHASNVTGALQPAADIADICKKRGVPMLLDAAQSAGHVPIDFSSLPIDLLATPGHKGLLGPLGTGVLLIRAGFEARMQTVREGGTGSASEFPVQPDFLPDRFEAGSHNAVGLAGLAASLRWIVQHGVDALRRHEVQLCERMMSRLIAIPGLTWYGPRDVERRVGVFSVRIDGLEPSELSAILESRFNILSRSGLHCAPLAHRTIGTHARGGTTRLSFGPLLKEDDIDYAADALFEIAGALAAVS
ncbi:MAG: aminotransferase class V-fold PLP-dependent enzyme [Phycisphaerales bacterium]|nr:aminotransferase class V-fold PLP-dependent enzyme [Phycisphaerales bacterium]